MLRNPATPLIISIYIFSPGLCKWHYFVFYGWIILRCIYVPQLLYPFLPWTFRLLPCSNYCKQCFSEQQVHASFWIMVYSGYILGVGLLGHMVVLCLDFFFLRNFHIVHHSSCINSHQHVRGFPFLHIHSSICCNGHSDRYEVIPHCSFELHFSKTYGC